MNPKISPIVRMLIAVAIIVALFNLPAREFLKVTFIMAIPFIILAGFMNKKRRYSPPWLLAVVLLLCTVFTYGNLLLQLPERIETRRIITEGAGLVAEGKYDQAIEEYKKLEELGKKEKMEDKIKEAEREKKAAAILELAKDAIAKGDFGKAREFLDSIPEGSRAAREAGKLQKSLE